MSIFMQIDGIEGSVTDQYHQGWLNILKIKWGTRRKIILSTGTGHRRISNAKFSELMLIRRMDKATPQLFREACSGCVGKDVTLHLTKTGQSENTYLEYSLKNVLVSHYRTMAHEDDVAPPNEEIRLSFSAIELKHIPYDASGKMQSPLITGFDLATHTVL